jgi:hypothetical protein
MATEELLQAEARERPRIAIVAGLAAALTLIAALVGFEPGRSPSNLPSALLSYQSHEGFIVASAVLSAIGSILVAFLLDFLFRATRARNPGLPASLRPLAFVGGFGIAAFTIAIRVILAVKISHFVHHGTQTYDEAKHATSFEIPAVLGLIVQLSFTIAIIVTSVSAMRVGLLSRLTGYLGVVSGVLFILQLLPIPIVQVYWLGALALLLWGSSPNGTPPAWERGVAVPWPSAQELREQRVREAEARRGAAPAPASAEDGAAPRRKRKKRR